MGNVVTKDNLVISLSEKSNDPSSNLAWAGLAFFKNNFIFKIIESLNVSHRGEYDITDAMNRLEPYLNAGTTSDVINYILGSETFNKIV